MIALLDVTKNNIMIYMIIVGLHFTVGLYHVMVSMGCLGLLEEVSYFYYFNLCDFHSCKKNCKKLIRVNKGLSK